MGKKRYGQSLSIGAKTLISHITLAIVVIALASVISYTLSSQYIRQTRIVDLTQKAERIAESSQENPDGDMLPKRRTVRTFEELANAKVYYLAEDNAIIRMTQYYPDSPDGESSEEYQWVEVIDSIDREFAERVLQGECVSTLRHFEFAQGVVIFAGAPIHDSEGNTRGGVILVQPVESLRSLSRMIRLMLAVVIGISVLLAILMAMQQTRMLVRPIQRITRAARRMEDGVYAERIPALPDNEIGELGHALNSMSGRLMDVIKNLRKERDKMELVISGIGEGLVAVDTDWNIVHANEAFLELVELDSAADFLREGADDVLFDPLKVLLEQCMQTGRSAQLFPSSAARRRDGAAR